jgi:hypothetical protein
VGTRPAQAGPAEAGYYTQKNSVAAPESSDAAGERLESAASHAAPANARESATGAQIAHGPKRDEALARCPLARREQFDFADADPARRGGSADSRGGRAADPDGHEAESLL